VSKISETVPSKLRSDPSIRMSAVITIRARTAPSATSSRQCRTMSAFKPVSSLVIEGCPAATAVLRPCVPEALYLKLRT